MVNHPTPQRLLWLCVILMSLVLYFPINRFAHGGIQLSIPIDQNLPLYPPAIIPYLFGSALFVGLPIWAAAKVRRGEFEAFTISILLGTVISYVVYLSFPTFVTRPDITSSDIFSRAIVTLYETDKAYNAAPSGHALYTTLAFLYLLRWKPNARITWLISALLILISTLLTRQHHILDLLAGVALGIITYAIGRIIQKKWELSFAS